MGEGVEVSVIRVDARVDIVFEEGTLRHLLGVDDLNLFLLNWLGGRSDLGWGLLNDAVDRGAVRALVDLHGAVDDPCIHVGPMEESLEVGDGLVGHTNRLLNLLGYG